MRIVKIKDSINKNIIDWQWFSRQPQYINIIEQNPRNLNWENLLLNPNAIHIIQKNFKKLENNDLYNLACNPNAIDIIKEYLYSHFKDLDDDESFWEQLSSNPNACSILLDHVENINWESLATNPNIKYIFTNLMIQKNKLTQNYLNTLNDENIIDISYFDNLYNLHDDFIESLSSNPNAIQILEKISGENYEKLSWYNLSINPKAINIIKKNKDKIIWDYLSSNPNAIDLIVEQIEKDNILEDLQPAKKIKKSFSFGNTELSFIGIGYSIPKNYIPYKNIGEINWEKLSSNINAVHILEKNVHKIDWNMLSSNINAINIIEKNLNKISWDILSSNINAIKLLKKNLDKINWKRLSLNPNAIKIFDDINFENLSNKKLYYEYLIKINYLIKVGNKYKPNFNCNHYNTIKIFDPEGTLGIPILKGLRGHFLNNIFEVNYKLLKDRMESTIGEELMKVMFHPKNINKFHDWGFETEVE